MKKIITSIFALCLLHTAVHANIFDTYLQPLKSAMSNCSINYTMKCTYPDGSIVDISGMMAMKGNSYYDSSNTRHVVLNNSWYIIADHIEKQISVAFIEGMNSQLKDIGSFNATSFLLNDGLDDINIKIVKQGTDTIWVGLTSVNSTVEYMELAILSKTLTPIKYTARINYPLGADYEKADGTTIPGVIKLDVNCYRIQTNVSDKLFDHSRIIVKTGKKASLKQYKNYKISN